MIGHAFDRTQTVPQTKQRSSSGRSPRWGRLLVVAAIAATGSWALIRATGPRTAETTSAQPSGQTSAPEQIWLTLWDEHAEDGDRVAVSSNGIRTVLLLRNAPQRIVLPRPVGGYVTLEGVADGGGGITVAVASASGPYTLPRLSPGQLVLLPVP